MRRWGNRNPDAEEDEPPPVSPISSYTDEHGRTITVYPPRYGVGMQPYTAKSRRRG